MLSEKELKVLEEMNFDVNECEQDSKEYVEISQYSPLGEDWICVVWYEKDGFANAFNDYATSFDYEEEAAFYIKNRGKYGIPESITALLKDSKWKKKILLETARKLTDIGE